MNQSNSLGKGSGAQNQFNNNQLIFDLVKQPGSNKTDLIVQFDTSGTVRKMQSSDLQYVDLWKDI